MCVGCCCCCDVVVVVVVVVAEPNSFCCIAGVSLVIVLSPYHSAGGEGKTQRVRQTNKDVEEGNGVGEGNGESKS